MNRCCIVRGIFLWNKNRTEIECVNIILSRVGKRMDASLFFFQRALIFETGQTMRLNCPMLDKLPWMISESFSTAVYRINALQYSWYHQLSNSTRQLSWFQHSDFTLSIECQLTSDFEVQNEYHIKNETWYSFWPKVLCYFYFLSSALTNWILG